MNSKFVIFYLNTSEKNESQGRFEENNNVDLSPDFPKDWHHVGSNGYKDKNDNYDFLLCPTIENAVTWIKGHLRSSHIYKICKWTLEENIKVFDNCPSLVEVQTE